MLSSTAHLALGLLLGGATLPPLSLQRTAAHRRAHAPAIMTDAEAAEPDVPTYRPAQINEANLKVGQVVECAVLGKLAPFKGQRLFRGYVVDIGASKPALVPRSHVALKPNATTAAGVTVGQGWVELPVGMVLEGQVLGIGETQVNVSFTRVQRSIAWERVAQLADLDVTVSATVLRLSEAGATLDLENLPAFLPWSHWSVPPSERTDQILGMKLPVKFLEVDRSKRRLVVSNRRVKLEAATAELETGTVVEGTIKAVKDYGAVVRLSSGVEGLLHVSQISQTFVKNVSSIFEEAAPVCCVVIKVDEDDGSISLSTKMLENKPGEMLKDPSAVFERARAAVGAADPEGDDAPASAPATES